LYRKITNKIYHWSSKLLCWFFYIGELIEFSKTVDIFTSPKSSKRKLYYLLIGLRCLLSIEEQILF